MGTTLTAMQAGSVATVKVAAIEGYSYLITEGATAATITAWAGTDWAAAISNAAIRVSNSQKFNPWAPFQGGGTAEIWVQPDATDQFGIDTHRTTGGDETELTSTCDRNDTTLNVLDTSTFASSGDVFVGNECMTYTSTTATTFVVSTRGKYSPFGADTGTRFAQYHRAGAVDHGINIQPKVTQYRRTWIGARVGIWEHRIVNGVLDVKSEAQCVYSGRVVETRTDAETGWTVVSLEHVLDEIKDATLFRDQYKAKIKEGCWLSLGQTFSASDDTSASSAKTANDLVVVSGTPANTYEVQEGNYTAGEIASILTSWLLGELVAARLQTSVGVFSVVDTDAGPRTLINYKWASAASTDACSFYLNIPGEPAALLGLQEDAHSRWDHTFGGLGGVDLQYVSDFAPMFALIGIPTAFGFTAGELSLTDEQGTWFDNYATMPLSYNGQPLKPTPNLGLYEYGVFLVANSYLMLGARATAGGNTFIYFPKLFDSPGGDRFRYGNVDPDGIPIVQVMALSYYWASLLKRLFYSSGTSTYNDSLFDSLPYGLGLGIPGTMLGTDFKASCIGVGGYGLNHPIWITKPMKISELLGADLVMQGKFLIWKNGKLRFSQWATPVADNSVATLDETNKAEPVGNRSGHRSATAVTKEWAKPVIKIEYDYDFKSGKYTAAPLLIEDRTYIDSAGGDPVTISCRNLDKPHLESLMPSFLARAPMVTRPMHKMRRSIDMRYFEGYAPGDVVLVTDADARDPATGARGVTARPGLIVSHTYDAGGPTPGSLDVTAPSGEVEVFFIATNRAAVYSPCAQVDDTQANSGYNAGTFALTCYAHAHSETTASADASNFVAGDKIRIIEIDPADPAAPTTWTRTIATVSGNVITPTAALSSPAWSSSLKYRIISDAYSTAVATQETDVYQADDATGLIVTSVQPYEYAVPVDAAYTDETHASLAELHATLSYGDGKPRDVGYDRGLIRTINNLIDHKTAHQSPSLVPTALTYVDKGTYELLMASEIYTGAALLTGQSRYLYVSPWYRSTDGTSVTIRVTLLRALPTDATRADVTRALPYSEATWSTSSTTWQTGSEKALTLDISSMDGWAWLLIEGTTKCSTRGLAQCIERERE